jgi:zinc transporter ZupT
MDAMNFFWLFGSALIGGLLVFLLPSTRKQHLQLILSFSGAFLFAVTLLHLIPEVYGELGYKAGGYVLAGFFIQLILEQLSRGVEHGHIHLPHGRPNLYLSSVVLGLSLHAFLEGMPLGGGHEHDHVNGSFLAGIALHKFPAAFALASILRASGIKSGILVLLVTLFALMSPAGALTGASFEVHYDIILAIVIGSFLHISTTILFESGSASHKVNIPKILAILAGVSIALLTLG